MIKSFILDGKVKNQLDIVFQNNIAKLAFDKKMWIAGGFAREVCNAYFGINNKDSEYQNNRRIISYLEDTKSSGDIDFFASNENISNEVISSVTIEDTNTCMFPSDFACNYQLYQSFSHKDSNPLSFSHGTQLKIQIVNKFFYEDIESCFNSFDVTNCMYAIKKEDSNYRMFYSTKALENDARQTLGLSSASSPFTISRITKYLKYRNLKKLSPDKKTQSIFKECLYKAIENNWSGLYNLNTDIYKENIKNLHRTIGFSKEELSIFIGFIKDMVVDQQIKMPCGSGYGVYVTNIYKDVDWATDQIINACK